MKKTNVLFPIIGFLFGLATPSFAQNNPDSTTAFDPFNGTDMGTCLNLYEQFSVKREGKATAYRLIGTRSNEAGQLIDSHQIWYSHEFTSKPIPPLVSGNILNSNYGYFGTLFDSVVKLIPDPQNPGQLIPQFRYGYSFNADMLPVTYYLSYLNTDSRRSLYSYNNARQLLTVIEEKESGGTWIPQVREEHRYSGNMEIIEASSWFEIDSSWHNKFRKAVWYNANSKIDSSYDENYILTDWVPSEAEAYEYNSNGQVTRATRYNRNSMDENLQHYDTELYSYDTGGKLQSTMYYFGSNSGLWGRKNNHYSGTVLDSIDTDTWDEGKLSWNDLSQTVLSYSGGLITKKETFYYDNGTLRPYNKLEFSSDANQNISYSGYFLWDKANQSYTAGVKHYYTYEPYGTTNISLINEQKEMIHLYPNPANEKVHIEIPFDGSGSYKVFSIEGKEVVAARFDSGSERLQVLDLELKGGIYMLLLSDGSGKSYSGKLAID